MAPADRPLAGQVPAVIWMWVLSWSSAAAWAIGTILAPLAAGRPSGSDQMPSATVNGIPPNARPIVALTTPRSFLA